MQFNIRFYDFNLFTFEEKITFARFRLILTNLGAIDLLTFIYHIWEKNLSIKMLFI